MDIEKNILIRLNILLVNNQQYDNMELRIIAKRHGNVEQCVALGLMYLLFFLKNWKGFNGF